MGCKYIRESYFDLVLRIKEVIFNVVLIIDIIVGYLNEIEE